MAPAALKLIFARLPRHIRKEMKESARKGQVDLWELVACNLSYEISIISQFAGDLDVKSILGSLSTAKAKPLGCTSFAIIDAHESGVMNQHVWFGRNLDWDDDNGALSESFRKETRPTKVDGERFETVTFPGMSGVLTGLSPGRFAVALNAACADGSDSINLAAQPPTFLLRRVLERCETFDAAVKMLSETPVMTSVIFTVVSAESFGNPDDAVVIERTPEWFAVRRAQEIFPDRWAIVATNSMQCRESEELPGLTDSSCWRQETFLEGAQEGKTSEEILKATEFGLTIYRAHGDLVKQNTLTVA